MANEERDAAIDAAYDVYVANANRVKPLQAAFDGLWNAAEKHTRKRIADELEELRDDTNVDMLWTRIDDYIEQLRKGDCSKISSSVV